MHCLIVLLILLVFLFCLAFMRSNHADDSRDLSCIALFGYIVTVLYLTVFNRGGVTDIRLQLIPFYQFDALVLIGMIENALLFLPAGALPLCAFPRWRIAHAILAGTVFSLLIESAQLITRRGIFDVNDLIANILGAALGALIYAGLYSVFQKRQTVNGKIH